MDRVHKADRVADALSTPGYEDCRQRRPIGFAPWPSVPEWELVRDTETFSDQEERLRAVLECPDDEDPSAM
jgi:hypothetical protein